jgi:hypothetical protein
MNYVLGGNISQDQRHAALVKSCICPYRKKPTGGWKGNDTEKVHRFK